MTGIVGCAVVLGTASLVACSESSGPTGPDNTITVQGRVVDEYLQPLPSTYVLIAGHETVTTDANGYFSVTKVSAPYDLILQIPDVGTRDLLIYHGLIRSDPLIVTPPMPFSTSFHSAYIWGSTYGGGPLPDPPDRKSSLLFDSPETQFVGSAGSGSYSMQPQWLGPDSTDGLLHALQWQFDPASGLPTSYTGYGATPLRLHKGDYHEGPAVTMSAPVVAGSIAGTINVPTGLSTTRKSLLLRFRSSVPARWVIVTDSTPTNSFTYVTPNLQGATFSLAVRATGDSGYGEILKTGIGANAADVVMNVPSPAQLQTPADGAKNVVMSTAFSWSKVSGAVYLVAVWYGGGLDYVPAAPNYYVFTTDTTVSLTKLVPQNYAPYRGTSYIWDVRSYGPFASVDDITTPTWFAPQNDGSSTVSLARGFSWTQ